MPIARLYFLGIPLQKKGRCLAVLNAHETVQWWHGFQHYRTWVQILILLKVFRLKIENY